MNKKYLCYLHIEKAAGTTLHDIFLNNFIGYYVDTPYPYIKGQYNCQRIKRYLRIDSIF